MDSTPKLTVAFEFLSFGEQNKDNLEHAWTDDAVLESCKLRFACRLTPLELPPKVMNVQEWIPF